MKDSISQVGANIAEAIILQCGKSLNGLGMVTNSFDKEHGLHPESLEHNQLSLAKDRKLVIEEISFSEVCEYIPGWTHRSFHNIKPNAAQLVDTGKLTVTI